MSTHKICFRVEITEIVIRIRKMFSLFGAACRLYADLFFKDLAYLQKSSAASAEEIKSEC